MPAKPPKAELAEIRVLQRRLRLREAELLACLAAGGESEQITVPRPGWPMQRLPECRAN